MKARMMPGIGMYEKRIKKHTAGASMSNSVLLRQTFVIKLCLFAGARAGSDVFVRFDIPCLYL